MRYAIIEDGVVTNIIVADESFNTSEKVVLIEEDVIVCIDYKYESELKEFIAVDTDKAPK